MPRPSWQKLPDSLQKLLEQTSKATALQREQGVGYTAAGMRESLASMTGRFVTQSPKLAWSRNAVVSGADDKDYPVPVRIYHPSPSEALPVLIFAHGGGHMAGSVDVYEVIARKLAIACQRVLVSIDYRLSPENPYPSGLLDLKNVIVRVFPTLDRINVPHVRRLAVAGDSGGGAITATAVHQLADEPGINVDRQVLIYPSLDYTLSSPSLDLLGEGYLLEKERIAWLFDQYFQRDEDRRQASPLFMSFPECYPKTLVVTAGYCPLRDEGLAYVERLASAGYPVESLHFPNMVHAFLNLEDLVPDECHDFYCAFGAFLIGA